MTRGTHFFTSLTSALGTGDFILILLGAGIVIGVLFGVLSWMAKASKMRKHFRLVPGMTFKQVIDILGAPDTQRKKNKKTICMWKKAVNGKEYPISGTFVDDIVKSIG